MLPSELERTAHLPIISAAIGSNDQIDKRLGKRDRERDSEKE